MAIENADYILELQATQPIDSDWVNEGDDELRQLKRVLQSQFPEAMTGAINNAKEADPFDDDESVDELLWSPKALQEFIKAHFADWNVLPGTTPNPICILNKNASQTVTGGGTKITWPNLEVDDSGYWDAANNWYMPTNAAIGRWRVSGQLYADTNNSGLLAVQIRRGGTNAGLIRECGDYAREGAVAVADFDVLLDLNGVDDYVEIYASYSNGNTEVGENSSTAPREACNYLEFEYIGAPPAAP